MCALLLFYILAIAVLYFKERYTVEAILIKLNIYENNYQNTNRIRNAQKLT